MQFCTGGVKGFCAEAQNRLCYRRLTSREGLEMTVLVAAQQRLGLILGGLLAAPPRCYAFSVDKAVALAGELQPEVVLLDVELGGTARRAVEAVPRLLARSPFSSVLVVTRRPSGDELQEAVDLGAFGCLDRAARDLAAQLSEAVAAAASSTFGAGARSISSSARRPRMAVRRPWIDASRPLMTALVAVRRSRSRVPHPSP